MEKKTLRKVLKQQRNAFSSQQVQQSSKAVVKQLLAWSSYQQAKTIMAYLAFGNELCLDELLPKAWEAGKKICVPYIVSATEMFSVEITSLEQLELDRYGIRSVRAPIKVVEPEELELILVPGVAFSQKGQRLGMGAGYYDRFLTMAPQAITCGIAYEALLQESLPVEQYDQPVDYIVTEKSILQIK